MLCGAGGGKLFKKHVAVKKFHNKTREREGSGAVFFVSAVWIWFDTNSLEPLFLIIITGIICCYLIKLMKSLLAPGLEQVFHVLPLGRQDLC